MSAAGKIRLAAAAAALCAALLMPVKISAQSLSAETESTREEMEDITEQTGEDLLARMDLEAVEEAVDELLEGQDLPLPLHSYVVGYATLCADPQGR